MSENNQKQSVGGQLGSLTALVSSLERKIDVIAGRLDEVIQASLLDQIGMARALFERVDLAKDESAATMDAICGTLEHRVNESTAKQCGLVADAIASYAKDAAACRDRMAEQIIDAVSSLGERHSKVMRATEQNIRETVSLLSTALAQDLSKLISTEESKLATVFKDGGTRIEALVKGAEEKIISDSGHRMDAMRVAVESVYEGVRKEVQSAANANSERLAQFSHQRAAADAATRRETAVKADYVVKNINDGRMLYYYPIEVAAAEARGLCDIALRPEFSKEYVALTRGLDEESIATANRIIARLGMIKGLEGRTDIYTQEEKDALKRVNEFQRDVVSIGEDFHCWRNYRLPVKHFEPNVFLYRYGMDLLSNTSAFRGKDIVDVGAYVGDSALILSEYTTGRVHCFEPSAKNYANMLKTFAMNGLERAVPVKMALGSCEKEALELRQLADRTSLSNEMTPSPESIETCKMTTLDAYVKTNNLQVGLIKVDIEGAEQDFIKGALATICTQRPALLLSIYHNADDFMRIKPIIEELDLGYTFRIYRPTIRSVVNETLLICEQPVQPAESDEVATVARKQTVRPTGKQTSLASSKADSRPKAKDKPKIQSASGSAPAPAKSVAEAKPVAEEL